MTRGVFIFMLFLAAAMAAFYTKANIKYKACEDKVADCRPSLGERCQCD